MSSNKKTRVLKTFPHLYDEITGDPIEYYDLNQFTVTELRDYIRDLNRKLIRITFDFYILFKINAFVLHTIHYRTHQRQQERHHQGIRDTHKQTRGYKR